MIRFWLTAAFVCAAAFGGTIVVPNANTNSPGNDEGTAPSSPVPIVDQTLFGAGQFPGAIDITGFSFRAAPGAGPVDWTFGGLSGYLSTSSKSPNGTGAAMMSTTFANNIGPDNTLVLSGTSVTFADAGCSGPGVCPFDMNINFTTPFYYNPANGSLLLELVSTGVVGSGVNDAVGFGSPEAAVARVTAIGSTTVTTGTLAYGNSITEFTFTSVPEPSSWTMMFAGAAALLWMRRRRFKPGRSGSV